MVRCGEWGMRAVDKPCAAHRTELCIVREQGGHERMSTLSVQMASKLSKMILTEKKFRPGERIPDERTLTQMFGVSRTIIREAIKILVADGVLIIERGVGTFVAKQPGVKKDLLNLKLISNGYERAMKWYEVRLMIEPQAAKFAAERRTLADVIALKEAAEACERCIALESSFYAADAEFHCRLYRATQNEIIERILAGVDESVQIGVDVEGEDYRIMAANAISAHRKIAECIEYQDGAGAHEAMQLHLQRGIFDMKSRYHQDTNDGFFNMV